MELYGLSKEDIRKYGKEKDGYYEFTVGEPVEVTVVKRRNRNRVLSSKLSKVASSDKMMMKYTPSNTAYFDKELIDSDQYLRFVSCSIDSDTGCVYIGKTSKYQNQNSYKTHSNWGISNGVISTSGVLSANGYVQKSRAIYYSNSLKADIVRTKVTVLALGVRGDKIYGIYHIPKMRGLAIEIDDSEGMGFSVVSNKMRSCWNWKGLYIEDWFADCKLSG